VLVVSLAVCAITCAAFAILYRNHDAFWTEVWLFGVVPAAFVVGVVLTVRDIFHAHEPWHKSLLAVGLLVLSVSLTAGASTHRFFLGQLFSSKPLDLGLPKDSRFLVLHRFEACPPAQPCNPHSSRAGTWIFARAGTSSNYRLAFALSHSQAPVPERFTIRLNGVDLTFPSEYKNVASIPVQLKTNNKVEVNLTGGPGTSLTVWVIDAQPEASPSP